MKMKKMVGILLAGIMSLCTCTSAIVSAAEVTPKSEWKPVAVAENLDGSITTTYEMEVTPEQLSTMSFNTRTLFDVDQTFTMTTSHRGGDRKYYGDYLRYAVTITDVNGNAVDNVVSVQLWDYNHSYPLIDHRIDADGYTVVNNNVPIVYGRMYYFKYVLTYGTTRTLRVHMQITAY